MPRSNKTQAPQVQQVQIEAPQTNRVAHIQQPPPRPEAVRRPPFRPDPHARMQPRNLFNARREEQAALLREMVR